MDKYKQKYRIDSARLKYWDYGSPGFYFVTICTKNRECYFGDITVETQDFASHLKEMGNQSEETQNPAFLRATAIGAIANQYWSEIPNHFPFVELDEYIVMPNHVHGILFLNKPEYID